jgi:hypothetical protein
VQSIDPPTPDDCKPRDLKQVRSELGIASDDVLILKIVPKVLPEVLKEAVARKSASISVIVTDAEGKSEAVSDPQWITFE